MGYKRVLISLLLTAAAFMVVAQEYWMQPQQFFFQPGENAAIRFLTGGNFDGKPWRLKPQDLAKVELHGLSTRSDIKAQVQTNEKENLTVALSQAGTALVALQSNAAFMAHEADTFNAYLKDAGLDEAYYQREQNKALNKPASEFCTRYIKLLLQVGDKHDDTHKKVVGDQLEIIPEKNPYALRKGDPIRFKILWRGKPLFGVKVRVLNRTDNRTTVQNIYTEQNGTMETHISNSGPWLVTVVKMEPSTRQGAEWQSYSASFVFGVK